MRENAPTFATTLASLAPVMLLVACQTVAPDAPPRTSAPQAASAMPTPAAAQPPAFIEAACGGCHAVEPPFLSPIEAAPSFEAIANRTQLTDLSLANWLADAHNYPDVMDFDLQEDHVNAIATYIITLRRDDFVPVE